MGQGTHLARWDSVMCLHEKKILLMDTEMPVLGKNILIIGTKPIYGDKKVLIMG